MLKNKIALVTGARSGIGRAIALSLAREGADIILNDLMNDRAFESVSDQIAKMGRRVMSVAGDVASEGEVTRIVSSGMDALGGIDILVNNAGLRTVVLCGVDFHPLWKMSVAEWDRMIAVNLRGPFLMSKAVLPQMIKQRQGSIINISSNAGHKAVPGKSAYTASKHALEGFTKALAGEVEEFHVRVNTLAPGGMVNVDGRRGMRVETIIPACIFLASDASQDVSGATIIATKWNAERGIQLAE